jgi:hypothetical protein
MRCTSPHIPSRLHTNGRGPVPFTSNDELLFKRVPPRDAEEVISSISEIPLSVFNAGPIPGMSLNRSRFCDPEDVLYDINSPTEHRRHDWGIIQLKYGQLRELTVEHPDVSVNSVYSFNANHEPDPCNYPHSELVVLENGDVSGKIKSRCKSLIKGYLQKMASWVRIPDRNSK